MHEHVDAPLELVLDEGQPTQKLAWLLLYDPAVHAGMVRERMTRSRCRLACDNVSWSTKKRDGSTVLRQDAPYGL